MNINITPELAEIIGIYIGDGYLRYEGSRKELDISGGYEEKEYYDNHVIPLCNQTFNISITGKFFPSRSTYGFVIRDRSVLEIFKEMGFPSGNKSAIIKIPDIIKYSDNKEIITRFLRGYFDTDGCVCFRNRKGGKSYSVYQQKYHYHSRILLTSVSEYLIEDLNVMLTTLGFKFNISSRTPKQHNWNKTFTIAIVGKDNLERWIALIGMKNTVKLSRYLIWKKFGFNPPHTTFEQRLNILDEKISPFELYGPVV
ncbi:MAG: LAGLIDADG family homing endonuclease [Nanoarchaeota archaeon]|nr:LAGLIDADG family homing endonuclease [Nanoarchaeota archaeon]